MSDNIPFDIQTEIIKRVLVVKSLIRLSSVSKQWKSLIESSEFITHHVKQAQPHHVLIGYEASKEKKYVSVVDDDDSFRQRKFSLIDPPTLNNVSIVDCSHGLVCLHVLIRYEDTCLITVWNPSIRKSVSILLPSTPLIVSFGVCPQTSDPKIVNITFDPSKPTAEVLTLSTRTWRSVPMNLSSLGSELSCKQVVIDGVIYRVACDLNPVSHHVIMSFDLTNEEFGEVALPDRLGGLICVNISKLKESLGVIDYHHDDALHLVYDIWIMSKNGVSVSTFTKLFSVKVDTCSYTILGFRMNGQPIMRRCTNYGRLDKELVVYDPNTKIMNGLGIYGFIGGMVNYTESLLLINYPDSIIIE